MGANASNQRPPVPGRPSAAMNGLSRAPARRRLPTCLRQLCALVAALAAASVFALNPTEKTADYIATHWTVDDGLPHNSVKQLFQTRDGYLWIGTGFGLARFDGLRFTVFTKSNTPGIPHDQIDSLTEMSDGSLWIGTTDGLVRYQGGKFTAYSMADGLRSRTINAVCAAPDGSLWIGGQNGITRWVAGKFVNDIDTSAYDMQALRAIQVDRRKAIWITAGAAVLRYQDGVFTRFARAEGLASNRVQRVCEDATGRMLAVTQNGLFRLEGEHFVPCEFNGALVSLQVSTATIDRSGNLWIGSIGGLQRVHGDQVVRYAGRDGRELGVTDALLEDREGCLWAGTAEGLYRLTDRRAYSLTAEQGIAGGLISAVTQTRDGSVWIAGWGNGITQIQGNTTTHYLRGAPLSHETVTRIYEAPDGTMWLGNRGSAVDHYEGGKVATYVYGPGVPTSRPVTALFVDESGTLLIGIDKRGLLELRDGQILPVPELAAWAADRTVTVWTFHRTGDNRLLMGTSAGLFQRQSDRSWQPVPIPGLQGRVVVKYVLEEANGTLWFVTDGLGLVRWRPGSDARSFGSRQGMLDDSLFFVLDDGIGSLWVCSARGIGRIRKSEFTALERGATATLNCITFGQVDGLASASAPGSGGPEACRLADGRLMFATDQGVAVIDPRSLQTNSQPPTVVIESVTADGQQLALTSGQAVAIPAGTNHFEIRYTALSLVAPQQLRFRYQLAGSDPRWLEAGRERSARYTHIAPGSYDFHVLACNNDGVWNEEGVTLAFIVRPFFYETTWFIGLVVAAGVAGVLGVYWMRAREARRQLANLEAVVNERTRQLQAEVDERKRTATALQTSETFLHSLVENVPVHIFRKDRAGRFTFANKLFCERFGRSPGQIVGTTVYDFLPAAEAEKAQRVDEEIMASGEVSEVTDEPITANGKPAFIHLIKVPVFDAARQCVGLQGMFIDVTERKRAEAELAKLHQQLLDTSRHAGMAEIATSVLHNVGNVLNSVNVSATLVADRVRESQAGSIAKVAALFGRHTADLADFLTKDARGQMIPGYLGTLAESLAAEQKMLLTELDQLRENIGHIKEIVAMQQAYATTSGVFETVSVPDLIEGALRIDADALARHHVATIRDYQARPVVNTDRHKVMQILINLVRNAKLACDDSGRTDKQITVRTTSTDHGVQIAIIDNGIGIPAENLTRIFNHGFTTRKAGHGFGLHSGALAAKELGGSLAVQSDGPGHGATFTLELPVRPQTLSP